MKYIKRYITPLIILIVAIFLKKIIELFLTNINQADYLISKISSILLIVSITWFIIISIKIAKKRYLMNYDIATENNLEARKLYTQFNILERIVNFLIIVIAIALCLMLFDSVRKYGVSVFASAGIAGIIIGLAAQKAIGTLLAGLQIAIAQPIRLDDVLIVEGEFGWVEEIKLTFVVIRLWDKRRLVLPTTYFIEKPFQNWTRTTSELLGTVYLYTDYSISIDALREEQTRLLKDHKLWDGKVDVIQVTDSKERHIEIRCLVSARNAPEAWDLRVFLREHLIKFIQEKYPDSLPKTRVTLDNSVSHENLNK